jgi:hypothetical protein
VERDESVDQARERELDEFPDIVGGHEMAMPTRPPLVAAVGDGAGDGNPTDGQE